MENPRHKYLKVVEMATRPETAWPPDPVSDALLRGIQGDKDVPDEVDQVLQICGDPLQRLYIEAIVVAGGDAQHLARALDLKLTVGDLYLHYMFDPGVFRSRLDRFGYLFGQMRTDVSQMPDPIQPIGQEALEWAQAGLEYGTEYLSMRFNLGSQMPTHDMTNRIINMAYRGSIDAMAVRKSTEARQWAATFLGAIKTGVWLQKSNDEGAGVDEEDWELLLSTPADSEMNAPGPVDLETDDILT